MGDKSNFNDSITDYNNAVDKRILLFTDEVGKQGPKGVSPLEIGEIHKAHADKLQELTGADYTGYKVMLTGDTVQHILKDHGENGKSDQSMSDPKDIARIGWVINNFDNAELQNKKLKRFSNSDGTLANIILLQKRVNGNYYVAEAVPNTKKKQIHILSAYKNIKKAIAGVNRL